MHAQELLDKTPLEDGDTHDFPVVWRQKAEGLRAEICHEQDDCRFADPRDMDNLGTMVCWHPNYILGDEQIRNGDGRGAVENAHAHAGRFRSIGMVARWARLAEQAPVVIPLYLYDHSGISMTAGHNAAGMGDTASGGWDEFGNARGWDSTCVGVIYTTPARILELCGGPRPEQLARGEQFYCPDDWKGTPEAWLERQLENEVKEYDAFLRGEVFYWRIADVETDETLESCGGYLPDVSAEFNHELDYVKQEAREQLAAAIETKRAAADQYAEIARCRHADCREHHPVAGAGEQVTCRSCREYLGLPEIVSTAPPMRMVYVLGFQHRIPGEGVGGFDWRLTREELETIEAERQREGFYGPDYQHAIFPFEIPSDLEGNDAITEYIDLDYIDALCRVVGGETGQ